MASRGRPTKYKEEFCQEVDVYLEANKDYYVSRLKGKWVEEQLKVKLPSVEDFSYYLDVNESTLYERKKKYPSFSKALGKIMHEQKKRLMEMSLSWEYNSTIAKLILSANHWMSETQKTEVKLDGNINLSEMSTEQLYEFIANQWQQ